MKHKLPQARRAAGGGGQAGSPCTDEETEAQSAAPGEGGKEPGLAHTDPEASALRETTDRRPRPSPACGVGTTDMCATRV